MERTAGAAVSEIYGSSGHDSGDDGASHTDRGPGCFGSGWGGPWRPDHSVYYRDADLSADRYGDLDEADQGMTRGEYADHAHDQPPDADPEDPDDDISAILHEDDHLPEPRTRQEVAREAAAWEQAPTLAPADAEVGDARQREHPYPIAEIVDPGETAGQEVGDGAADQAAETGDIWRQRIDELEAANTELGRAVSELETENSQLGRGIAALEARLEQLEQHDPESQAGDVEISNRTRGGLDEDTSRPEHEQRRRLPSDEAILFGAAGIGGALTTTSYYLSYMRPDVAGITASVLAAGAAGLTWIHKRREASHADRPKD